MRTWAVAEAADAVGMPVTYVTTASSSASTFGRRWGVELLFVDDPTDRSWHDDLSNKDVALFDGYNFTSDDFISAGERCRKVAAIDDFGHGEYPVDLLISATASDKANYRAPSHCEFLLGPAFALVRSEFRRAPDVEVHGRASMLVVTMGGSDPSSVTSRIAEALRGQDRFGRIAYVQGPSQPSIELSDDPRASVVRDPPSLSDILGQASAAVSATGNTTWELLTMGVPSALIQTADNQRRTGLMVAARRAGLFLGPVDLALKSLCKAISDLSDRRIRRLLASNARSMVDGLGAGRVVKRLLAD